MLKLTSERSVYVRAYTRCRDGRVECVRAHRRSTRKR